MVNSREEMKFPNVEEFLKNRCFSVTVNMNDTFMFACGDCERISVHDLGEALRLHEKYGSAGLDAFVIAKRRAQTADKEFFHSDCIKPYYPQEYWDKLASALKELEEYETFPGAKVKGYQFDDA